MKAVLLLLILVGCTSGNTKFCRMKVDHDQRIRLFTECMENMPERNYSGTSDVVGLECKAFAHAKSYKEVCDYE